MLISVQSAGMGGVATAYPLDAPSAYHQPAIRTAIGSRLDLQGGSHHVTGFGLNEAFCSWIAGGISAFEGGMEGGVAFALRSYSSGFSWHSGGWTAGFRGEWIAKGISKGAYGLTYRGGKHPKWDMGIAIYLLPSLTIASDIHKVGIEWRPSMRLAVRGGFASNHRFSIGATYYAGLTQEFSFFADTYKRWGLAAALKW